MLSAFLQEQIRADSQGNSHCSYLDLVMSDVCCENKSKKVNSDIMQEILSVFPQYLRGWSRSTHYLGHR